MSTSLEYMNATTRCSVGFDRTVSYNALGGRIRATGGVEFRGTKWISAPALAVMENIFSARWICLLLVHNDTVESAAGAGIAFSMRRWYYTNDDGIRSRLRPHQHDSRTQSVGAAPSV